MHLNVPDADMTHKTCGAARSLKDGVRYRDRPSPVGALQAPAIIAVT